MSDILRNNEPNETDYIFPNKITISKLNTKTKAYKFKLNVEKTKAKNKPILEKKPYKYNFSSDKTEGTYKYVNREYIKE